MRFVVDRVFRYNNVKLFFQYTGVFQWTLVCFARFVRNVLSRQRVEQQPIRAFVYKRLSRAIDIPARVGDLWMEFLK